MGRNFIPEGEDSKNVRRPFGGRLPNFIPDEGFVVTPPDDADQAERERRAARASRRVNYRKREWARAVESLRASDERRAVDIIRALPPSLQQLYVLVESTYAHRTAVLSMFPAPAPSTLEAWADFLPEQVAEPVVPTIQGLAVDADGVAEAVELPAPPEALTAGTE